ncbi:MAG: outer membrane lipoprotein-sorting protein [Candidatus Rifleibacteriota bacterium]
MKRGYVFLILFVFLFVVYGRAMALTAQEVLQQVEDRYVGKTSKANVIMKLIDKSGNVRERKMTISRRKKDNVNKDNFILFAAPPDIRNTSYLVNEVNKNKQKWIYLSAFKKIRKIVAEDYGMSFVSSDFTYEDMEDIHAQDYTASNLKEEKYNGEDVYSISITKNDSNTSYSRVDMKISKEKLIVLKSEMYDKKDPNKLIKVMTAENIEKIQDIWTPRTVTMKDLVKGTSTVLETVKIKYDLDLPDDEFSKRNMEK